MVLTDRQIEEILSIIEKNHLIYSGVHIGVDVLSESDKSKLRRYGIDVSKLKQRFSTFEQSFYFGRLSSALSDPQVRRLRYKDFLDYLRRGQYIPLSDFEKDMLFVAKRKTYGHLKNLEKNVVSDVNDIVNTEDRNLRRKREKIISGEIKRGIAERESLSTIASEIGKKTEDWQRDLGRIVNTEYQNIFNEGRALQLQKKHGDGVQVYKDVYPGACRHCIKAYLTNGIGSKPKVFTLSELIENGDNIGRKVKDWKPVLYSMHPWCRCNLYHKDPATVWNQEKGDFEFPEKIENKIERKRKNKLIVGDKTFWV